MLIRVELSPKERQALVTQNLRLAYYMAGRYYRRYGGDREELRSEAEYALARAASTYDPALAKFSTYAGFWIRAVLDHYRRRRVRRLVNERLWLHESVGDFNDFFLDTVAGPDSTDSFTLARSDREEAARRLADLVPKERDRAILVALMEDGATLESVGQRFDLSREAIRQIRNKWVERMRAA
jgi:RNA polymerase sigma factor (sigma-70 family)